MCQSNVQVGNTVKSVLDKLDTVLPFSTVFDGRILSDFIGAVQTAGSQLKVQSKNVDEWVNILSEGSVGPKIKTILSSLETDIDNAVKELFYGVPKWIDLRPDQQHPKWFETRFSNFYYNVCNPEENNDSFLSQLTGNIKPKLTETELKRLRDNCAKHFSNYLYQTETAIVEIIRFFLKWNFFSYTCDYMQDVEVDVEIQRKDALEFPNYCIVLPLEVFEGLYVTQIVRNFSKVINSDDPDREFKNEMDVMDTNINLGDVNRLIKIVNTRLKIPNLILIDNKSKTCYYQFMYMTKPIKCSLSNMASFITHQKSVLPGF
jgi:hypothetical protein